MKRKLSIVLTIVMALTVLSVAPVSANGEKPINGKMDLTLAAVECADPVLDDYKYLTWFGTVVIDGTTYGWADFPPSLDPPVPEGNFTYFFENWTIFRLPSQSTMPTVEMACNANLRVLAGDNTGRGTRGSAYRADGKVRSADPDGDFADVEAGSRMIWRGKVTSFITLPGVGDIPYEFKATLHIFPLK